MPFWFIKAIGSVALNVCYILCGGIRFEGRQNVPAQGGVVIAPNHISDWDPPTVVFALPRHCWTMAKEEIFRWKLVGPLVRWLHGFPVKRGSPDRAALRRAEHLLKQGEAVLIFPEGKTSEDGRLQQLLPGALLVAREADVPIVPTVIFGTDRLVPFGQWYPRPMGRPIIVRFGPPVRVDQLTGGMKGGDALRRGAERLGEILMALQQDDPYRELSEDRSTAGIA